MAKFSTRYRLSKKALKELKEEVTSALGAVPMEWNDVEEAKAEDIVVYIDGGLPCLVRVRDAIFPTLVCLLKRGFSWLPRVIVDRGATRAIGNGADLMAPGVRSVEGEFRVGSVVAIVDEQARVPVAVGRALVDSARLREMIRNREKGKVVENVHYPGDRIWELIKQP